MVLQGSVALRGDSLVLPTPGYCGLPRAAGPAPGAEPVGPVSGRRPPAWPVSRPGLSPSCPAPLLSASTLLWKAGQGRLGTSDDGTTDARVAGLTEALVRAACQSWGRRGVLSWRGSLGCGCLFPRVGVRPRDFLQVLQRVQLDGSHTQAVMEVFGASLSPGPP